MTMLMLTLDFPLHNRVSVKYFRSTKCFANVTMGRSQWLISLRSIEAVDLKDIKIVVMFSLQNALYNYCLFLNPVTKVTGVTRASKPLKSDAIA